MAVVQAARDQELACALGRGLVEDRGLGVDEAVGVEVAARRARGRVAQPQSLLHRLAAQVEVAILEAHLLGNVLLVDHEGRRSGCVEDLGVVREFFDLPALQAGIHRALRTAAHHARHAQHELVAHAVGRGERGGAIGMAYDLHQAFAVAQVDEDHPAMVAAAVHPAVDRDGLAKETSVDEAAIVGAHYLLGPPRLHDCRGRLCHGDGGAIFICVLISCAAGSATPIEMMYLSAASTVMSSSIVSERGTMRKKPEVILGVVGMNTEIWSFPRSLATSCCGVPVTSATVHAPGCG